MTIQNKIYSLVAGLIVAIIFILGLAFYTYLITTSKNELDSARTLLLKSYKSYENFTLLRKETYVENYGKAIYELKSIFQENTFTQDSELLESMEKYDSLFIEYSILMRKRGLDENSGIEGKFRRIIHEIENDFTGLNNDKLSRMQLEIRRREKDFLLRGDHIYVEMVIEEIDKLIIAVDRSPDIIETEKSRLIRNLQIYREAFLDISEVIENLNALRIELNIQLAAVEDEVDKIYKKVDVYAENYITVMFVAFCLTLLSSIILSILTARSIIKPLNFMKKSVAEIDVDNFDKRINYYQDDEIGELSRSFNNMLIRLDRAYQEIESTNELLETKVEERTKELKLEIEDKSTYEIKLKAAFEKISTIKEELKKALSKEKELNQLKSNFVRMVSHEYRTPLAIILTSAYLLDKYFKANDKANFTKHLNTVKESVESMKALMEDTLTLSTIDSGDIDVNKSEIEMVDFIQNIINSFDKIKNEGQDIILHTNFNNLFFSTDPKKLESSINNLLNNSIKYSNSDEPIIVDLKKSENNLDIMIIDKGIGIPKADQEHIFSPFYRSSNIENTSGSGLGLSITKELIESLGGRITFRSEENIGTTFHISFDLDIKTNKDQA